MFWYIGNALDFRPRGPWFESGRLQQFFSSLFFSFWPFTVPFPLLIKTRRITNNVINNHVYFIIPLLSLDPLLFECSPYGRWLFLKSGFYIPVFCEQYRRYFRLVFVDFGVCCSWDYMLSKCPLIFFNQMSSWSVMMIINIIIIIIINNIVITITIKIIIIMIIMMIIIVYMSI